MKKLLLFFMFCPLIVNAQTITTYAGTGTADGYYGDGGPSISAVMSVPEGMCFDHRGNLYVADFNNVIRKVSPDGIITTIAGNGYRARTGSGGYSGDGGPADSAELQVPTGVAIDSAGNLYIADDLNHRIRKVNSLGIITTIAGTGIAGYSGDGGPADSAKLNYPEAIAIDRNSNLYIADEGNYRIRKVDASGTITTFAGTGSGFGGDGGLATAAKFLAPAGIAIDDSGNVYIADRYNQRVRKVNTSGIITTIAGNGYGAGISLLDSGGYSGDGGPATAAELNDPIGLACDHSGNLYIGDQYNHRIRKVNRSGIITTIAGNGYGTGTLWGGYSGDGGPAISAELNSPGGVVFDDIGNMYIADALNFCIRKVTAIPDTDSICDGSSLLLNYHMLGGGWTSSAPGIASVNSSTGLVTGVSGGMATIYYNTGIDTGFTTIIVDTCSTTNVSLLHNFGQLTIYPNPTTGELNISTSDKITTINISNVLGQVFYGNEYNTEQVHVDISRLPNGVYFVKVNGNEVRKFVKQ